VYPYLAEPGVNPFSWKLPMRMNKGLNIGKCPNFWI